MFAFVVLDLDLQYWAKTRD